MSNRRRARDVGTGNSQTSSMELGEHLLLALRAAGTTTWQIDVPSGKISYSKNLSDIVHGTAITRYCTVGSVLKTVHSDDRRVLRQAIKSAIVDGKTFDCEYRCLMLDGKYHWIAGKGKMVVRDNGKPVRVLGISQDIDARKQMENELRLRSRQLARLASELTMAEHRERRRLADVLHEELQQLLVGARIQAHSMETGKKAWNRQDIDMLRRALDEALDSARSITRDLAAPAFLHSDPVTAFECLASEMTRRYRMNVTFSIDRSFRNASEPTMVLLFTAARELLLNVVKHSGAKMADLQLRCRNGSTELSVADRGTGFDPEIMRRKGDRQGFGLFSIRERAELLNGKMTVYSSHGAGTRVCLSLPMKPVKGDVDSDDQKPFRRIRPRTATGLSGRCRRKSKMIRIVCADDHRTVREGLVSMLTAQRGCKVIGEADNGKQAVSCVRRLQPDVVIMDVDMPVMDGVQATRLITERWPFVKVIGLSMHDDMSVAKKLIEAGAVDFVTKSDSPERLLRAIRASCRTSRGTNGSRSAEGRASR